MKALDLAFLMVFHPTDAYQEIKKQDKAVSIIPAIIILLLVLFTRYLYVTFVHSPLADIKLQDTNIFLEVFRIILPILTLSFSLYAVTTILYGETKIKTIFVTVTYSFIPYVIMTPLFMVASRFISLSEGQFYYGAAAIKWIWIILLIFFSIMIQNDYTFKKTVGVSLLTIFGVLLIWAVAIMVIALSVQVFTWFKEVTKEIVIFNLN